MVTSVNPSPFGGGWVGAGYIVVPYLQDTKVRVSFNNIKINTDYQFIEGIIETEYDPTWGGIDDIGDEIAAVGETIEVISDLGAATADILEDVFGETPDNTYDDDTDLIVSEGSNTTESGTDNTNNENENPINNSEGSNSGVGNSLSNEIQPGSDVTANETSTNVDTNSGEVAIVYNGNEFRNGDIIEIIYRNNLENQRFDIKNVDEGSIVSWSLHSDMDQVQAIASAGEGVYTMYDVKNYQNKALEAQYSLNDKSNKIRVQIKIIKEEFEFIELYAKPKLFPNRLAKSDEILYLIDDSGFSEESKHKEVDFGLKLDPKLEKEKIDPIDIKWYYGYGGKENTPQNIGEPIILQNIRTSEYPAITKVSAGYPINENKSIDVVWVDEDRKIYNVVPPGIQNTVEIIFENIKLVKKISDKFGKYGAEINPSVKFFGAQFNEEDSESRHYFTIRDGGIKANVGISYNIPLPPPFSYDLTIPILDYEIGKIGAFIKIKADMGVDGSLRYKRRNDQTEFVKAQNTIALKGSGGIDFGVEARILPEVESVTFDIKAYGKSKLVAAGKLIFYQNEEFEFKPQVYFDPLVAGFSGKIKAMGYTVFDNSFEWQLLDRIDIYTR